MHGISIVLFLQVFSGLICRLSTFFENKGQTQEQGWIQSCVCIRFANESRAWYRNAKFSHIHFFFHTKIEVSCIVYNIKGRKAELIVGRAIKQQGWVQHVFTGHYDVARNEGRVKETEHNSWIWQGKETKKKTYK